MKKTISFVGTTAIENALKEWAEEGERSVSSVLRELIKKEKFRRRYQEKQKDQSDGK